MGTSTGYGLFIPSLQEQGRPSPSLVFWHRLRSKGARKLPREEREGFGAALLEIIGMKKPPVGRLTTSGASRVIG